MNRLTKHFTNTVRSLHQNAPRYSNQIQHPKTPYEQGYEDGFLHGMNIMLMVGTTLTVIFNINKLK